MRQHVILRNALTSGVHQAKVVLRFGVPLLSGQPEPLGGFGVILRNALAVVVHLAKVVLRFGDPLLGQWSPFFQGSFIISSFVGLQPCIEVLRECDGWEQGNNE